MTELEIEATTLRFVTDRDEIFLWGDRSLWSETRGPGAPKWTRVFSHEGTSSTSRNAWALIASGDTPRKLGDDIYFPHLDDGNSPAITIIDTRYPLAAPRPFRERWVVDHFGRAASSAYSLTQDATGALWATMCMFSFPNQATLFRIDTRSYQLPIVQGSVDRAVKFDEGTVDFQRLTAEEYRQQVPATATWVEDDEVYLAGPEGIARVRDGHVTPIVRFTIDAEELADGNSNPDQFVPHSLERFRDGSFLLSAPYDGALVVDVSDPSGPRVRDVSKRRAAARMIGVARRG